MSADSAPLSFLWPIMLWSLLALPLGVGLYLVLQQRRRVALRASGFGLASAAAGRRPSGLRRHIPPLFFLAGLAVLLVGLARPQAVVSLPRVEGTVMLVFDVSGSMAADDLKPTRMEAAKAAALNFVQRQPATVQIGVVAFSDSGLAIQAPTDDQAVIIAAINRLAPARGTSLGNGILAALTAIAAKDAPAPRQLSNLTPEPTAEPTPLPAGVYAPAVILLLTDGENNERPDPLEAAQLAADRGVRIFTVGIGSTAGTTLTVNGFTVHTQLEETVLQAIAQLTHGLYYNAQDEASLQAVYDNLTPQLVIRPEKMEVTALFAGAGIAGLLIGGLLSLVWFSRLP